MSRGFIAATVLSLLICLPATVQGGPARGVQIEVDFLLGFVEESGCDFYRNGTWHTPAAARAHLRQKYDFLAARDMIQTTEDFIEKAASKSSLSGDPYQVKCKSGAATNSGPWLRGELERFRAFNKKPASSLLTPRPTVPGTP
jgi:hypothetical protein